MATVVLIAVVVVLTPVALASPADPTWIAGIYDDGDYDDVILLVTSASSTLVSRSGHAVPLDLAPAGPIRDAEARLGLGVVRLAFEGRAPPLA
ncbi:MAG: hypothetical protein DME04_18950 [Candidatus Rokuibacteriota bacterium]|nr:MAG: hypothetical protein DME04_18950 [Candidatus Rokubacteria bacterium]